MNLKQLYEKARQAGGLFLKVEVKNGIPISDETVPAPSEHDDVSYMYIINPRYVEMGFLDWIAYVEEKGFLFKREG